MDKKQSDVVCLTPDKIEHCVDDDWMDTGQTRYSRLRRKSDSSTSSSNDMTPSEQSTCSSNNTRHVKRPRQDQYRLESQNSHPQPDRQNSNHRTSSSRYFAPRADSPRTRGYLSRNQYNSTRSATTNNNNRFFYSKPTYNPQRGNGGLHTGNPYQNPKFNPHVMAYHYDSPAVAHRRRDVLPGESRQRRRSPSLLDGFQNYTSDWVEESRSQVQMRQEIPGPLDERNGLLPNPLFQPCRPARVSKPPPQPLPDSSDDEIIELPTQPKPQKAPLVIELDSTDDDTMDADPAVNDDSTLNEHDSPTDQNDDNYDHEEGISENDKSCPEFVPVSKEVTAQNSQNDISNSIGDHNIHEHVVVEDSTIVESSTVESEPHVVEESMLVETDEKGSNENTENKRILTPHVEQIIDEAEVTESTDNVELEEHPKNLVQTDTLESEEQVKKSTSTDISESEVQIKDSVSIDTLEADEQIKNSDSTGKVESEEHPNSSESTDKLESEGHPKNSASTDISQSEEQDKIELSTNIQSEEYPKISIATDIFEEPDEQHKISIATNIFEESDEESDSKFTVASKETEKSSRGDTTLPMSMGTLDFQDKTWTRNNFGFFNVGPSNVISEKSKHLHNEMEHIVPRSPPPPSPTDDSPASPEANEGVGEVLPPKEIKDFADMDAGPFSPHSPLSLPL